jgi:uncharacterized membrane protein YphA (DoxX/SURF4 family)
MVVAIVTAKLGDVTSANDFVGLIEVTYLVLLIWILQAGGGRFSLDTWVARLASGMLPPSLFRPDLGTT